MMFRLLATNGNVLLRKHQQGHQLTRLVTRGFKANAVVSSSTPNAQDVVVKLTFVDPNGARRKATGYVGKSSIVNREDRFLLLRLHYACWRRTSRQCRPSRLERLQHGSFQESLN